MKPENRIKEIVFKDGRKEYYPQIKIELSENGNSKDLSISVEETEDGWMWIRKHKILKRYELRANDFECVCKTKEIAVEIIKLYYKQISDIEESYRLDFEKKQKREDSIKETNYLEIK